MAGVREARTAAYRAPEGPQGDRFPLRAFPCLRGGLRLVGGLPAFCLAGGVMEGSQRGLPCGPFRVSGKLRFASDNFLAFCKEFWIL